MDWRSWLDSKPFSEATRDRYGRALRLAESELGNLSAVTVSQFRDWLFDQPWGDSMRWIAYTAVKGYCRWAYGESHPIVSMRIKRGESPPGRSLSGDQVRMLLESFDQQSDKGIRDLAICSLAIDSGLRCSEICGLLLARVDLSSRSLTVRIKGGRWGDGWYSAMTAGNLAAWLAIRERYARPGVGQCFVSIGGLTRGKSLTRSGLQEIVEAWGSRLGIKLSPHDFRRTFAEQVSLAGAPARVLMLAGRWRDVDMVLRYTRNLEAKRIRDYLPLDQVLS